MTEVPRLNFYDEKYQRRYLEIKPDDEGLTPIQRLYVFIMTSAKKISGQYLSQEQMAQTFSYYMSDKYIPYQQEEYSPEEQILHNSALLTCNTFGIPEDILRANIAIQVNHFNRKRKDNNPAIVTPGFITRITVSVREKGIKI